MRGKFKAAPGNEACTPCPPGSFRNASAERAEFERCPRGQVTLHSASGGAHDCVACDVGSYAANTVNGSFCRACMLHANTSEEYVGVYDPLNDADDSYHPDSPTFRSNINLCRCSAGYFRGQLRRCGHAAGTRAGRRGGR